MTWIEAQRHHRGLAGRCKVQLFCAVGKPTKSEKLIRKATLDMSGTQIDLEVNKNFIRNNALHAIHSKPAPGKGTDVQFVQKADYGKVPKYLSEIKQKAKDDAERAELQSSQCLQQV